MQTVILVFKQYTFTFIGMVVGPATCVKADQSGYHLVITNPTNVLNGPRMAALRKSWERKEAIHD